MARSAVCTLPHGHLSFLDPLFGPRGRKTWLSQFLFGISEQLPTEPVGAPQTSPLGRPDSLCPWWRTIFNGLPDRSRTQS